MPYRIDKNRGGSANRRNQVGIATAASSAGRDGYSAISEFYELEPAVVISVELEEPSKLGQVILRPIYSYAGATSDLLPTAIPLDSNIKSYPLVNEIVIAIVYGGQWYWTQRMNYFNSVNNNMVRDFGKKPGDTESTSDSYKETSLGNPNAALGGDGENKNSYFESNFRIKPLLPMEGDIIHEGRFGNSLRFGGTVPQSVNLPSEFSNTWAYGKELGSPIIILRNGQSDKIRKDDEIAVEDINKDYSSIYLTSDQTIPFIPVSRNQKSYAGNAPSIYDGKQILVTSDRLMFNAKREEILMFSLKSIGLSSRGTVNIDSNKETIVNSPNIYLGLDAEQHLVLGDKTAEWLQELSNVLKDLIDAIQQSFVATGTGPSSTIQTTSAAKYTPIVNKITSLENEIQGLLSKKNFTL